jgi:hypothetical protein
MPVGGVRVLKLCIDELTRAKRYAMSTEPGLN